MASVVDVSFSVTVLLFCAVTCGADLDPGAQCRQEVLAKAPSIKSFLGTKIKWGQFCD